jgi:aminoglycoside 3-N-acetyltransferase I
MHIKIKKLEAPDFKLAKQLFWLFQKNDGVKNPLSTSDKYLKNLLSKNDFYVLVARDGENILGGLTAYQLPEYKREEAEMFLYEIVVDKKFRRKKIATNLIESLIQICKEKKINEMFLVTEMDNIPAQNLYSSTGGIIEETAIFSYKF